MSHHPVKGIIVLEGADGTGKTTLARILCDRYNAQYLHMTYRFRSSMFAYNLAVIRQAITLSQERLVVLDRCWLSEAVYARVYRGGSAWPHMGRLMDRILRRFCAIYVIHMEDDLELYNRRYKKLIETRPEMYDGSKMQDVMIAYHDVYDGGECFDEVDREYKQGNNYLDDLVCLGGMKKRKDTFQYRITVEGTTVTAFAEELVKVLLERRDDQPLLLLEPNIGNFLGYMAEAKILLIGDRLSAQRYHKTSWPFVAYQNSSLFLLEAMSKLGLDEQAFCWVNVNELHGSLLINMLCNYMRPICLGNEAVRGYTAIKPIPHTEFHWVNHPSYYRRFAHHEGKLEADLRRAIADGE